MNIKELYNQREALESIVDTAGDRLKAYELLSNGLVSDTVRDTAGYKRDYKAYKQAFSTLQAFNKGLTKTQQKQLRALKRQLKWGLK